MALTPKQEAFAQAIVTGVNQSDAYRAAFTVRAGTKPESVNVSASKLMSDPKVTQRVAELRKPVAEIAQITLKTHLDDLLRLRNMAAKEKQYSAAIAAEVARGKASGVHIEKTEQTVKTTDGVLVIGSVMSPDDWEAAAKVQQAALVKDNAS